MIARILPYPVLSVFLFGMWLLLQGSVAPGTLLMGAIVAIAAGQAMTALEPESVRIKRPWLILRLVGVVVADIIRSNLAVFWIIVTRGRSLRTSGFLEIPLELRNRYGLTALGIIITATPGTVWMEFDAGRGILMIHVLDLVDEQHWIDTIKTRYERLILEILG